ncbi:hypothetical protein [Mycolicibacterium litorale]|uniref:hypothetical protein n=1 Tax=Mycolicibacterium litorale TaxID=758802 RepID=UPI00106513DD|nr:hypothetical protein [Mycolicibacterium litorale]MCV7416498.1 hypothetical protein [Mycolicibacterium litorale]
MTPALQLGGHQGPTPLDGTLTAAGVTLLGPADCEGINALQIVRRSPVPGDGRHEPNFLALIEFGHADLPWLFSGGARDGRFDPWLMLVVVRSKGAHRQGRIQSGPRGPVLRVLDGTALSSPAQAWAFAHVQVAGDVDGRAVVTADPQASGVRSRIICPTKLAPNTDYIAALVPTFELGRLAGLGVDVPAHPDDRFWEPGGKGFAALNPPGYAFWSPGDGLQLPAYDHWSFTTGPAGDFESLARKLRKVPSAAGLGERRVAVEARASLMQERPEGQGEPEPDFAPGVERVPTAIARVDRQAGEPPLSPFAPDQAAPTDRATRLQSRLKELVDLVATAEAAEPVVGPPLYGQWAAGAGSLDVSDTHHWVTQLNADPYQRMAAGLGARVVAHDQESLMAEAWQQLADLEDANRRIRIAALMASALQTLHTKLAAAPDDIRLRFTSSSFGRIAVHPGRTLHAELQTTTLPLEALGPSMVRAAARARRAAVASSAVAELHDARVSPTTISAAIVTALASGSATVIPQRLTHEPRVDLDAVRTVLGSDALIGRLAVLENVSAITATIADRLVEPDDGDDMSVHDDVAVRIGPRITEQIGDQDWAKRLVVHETVNRPVHEVIRREQRIDTKVLREGADPGLLRKALGKRLPKLARRHPDVVIDAQRVDGVPDAVRAPARMTMPVRQIAAVHREELPVPAGVQLSLASEDVRLALGPALRSAPGTLLSTTISEPTNAAALGAAEAIRISVLAELGITRSSAPARLGQLSDGDVAAFRAAVDLRARKRSTTAKPPRFAAFDATATQTAVTALDPRQTYRDLLAYAHTVVSDDVVRMGKSFFHPLRAAPKFTQPLVKRLAVVDKDWLLGGVGGLAPNSVSVFGINARFIEAFLAGANHEIMRELTWRGYPTDVRGTCFRRFWDLPQPDVKPLAAWTSLGDNHAGGTLPQDLTVVVIKGDLLRRYPTTIVSAVRGRRVGGGFEGTEEAAEIDRGHIDDDVNYSILDIAPSRLLEPPDGDAHRWYVSLLENTREPRFGLDDKSSDVRGANAGRRPVDWSWQGLPDPVIDGGHLTAGMLAASATSTQVGVRLCQRPFRALLPATEFIVLD